MSESYSTQLQATAQRWLYPEDGQVVSSSTYEQEDGTFFESDDWPPEQEGSKAVVAILIALIIILFLVLFVVTIPPLIQMIRRKMPIPQARIDRRYATIDGWLVTKRIRSHDDVCSCIQKHYSPSRGHPSQVSIPPGNLTQCQPVNSDNDTNEQGKENTESDGVNTNSSAAQTHDKESEKAPVILTASMLLERLAPSFPQRGTPAGEDTRTDQGDEDSVEQPSCPICMEAFKVRDKVSWSTDSGCGHVFHHTCIREWLLRRTVCPCCRHIMLPVDRPLDSSSSLLRSSRPSNALLAEMAKERARRMTSTYYCVDDGLVTLFDTGGKIGVESALDLRRNKTDETCADTSTDEAQKPFNSAQQRLRHIPVTWVRRILQSRPTNTDLETGERTAQASLSGGSESITLPSAGASTQQNDTVIEDSSSSDGEGGSTNLADVETGLSCTNSCPTNTQPSSSCDIEITELE